MLDDIDRNRRRPIAIRLGGLLALKWSVVVAVVIGWNILLRIAFWLNGGAGVFHDRRAEMVAGLASLGLGSFCSATTVSERFRRIVLAPERRHRYHPSPYVYIGFVAFGLTASMIGSSLGLW